MEYINSTLKRTVSNIVGKKIYSLLEMGDSSKSGLVVSKPESYEQRTSTMMHNPQPGTNDLDHAALHNSFAGSVVLSFISNIKIC
jgi:hypothetical protein